MSNNDLFEIESTQSSAQKDKHKIFIQKLENNGYTIQSQDKTEEKGLDDELISLTLETTMKPPMSSLPLIRLEAKEIFGNYDWEEESFQSLESPKFQLSAYKKGAELHNFNDEWDKFDLS